MSNLPVSAAKITACPECGSGNLYANGSEVECLSCGWKHAAKKPRSAKAKAKAPTEQTPNTPSIAEQLQAAVTTATVAKKAKGERKVQDDITKYTIIKEFKPRTDQLTAKGVEGKGNFSQAHNWEAISALLKAGPATRSELEAAIIAAAKVGGYEATCNARGFVQGRVRNGHIAPVAA